MKPGFPPTPSLLTQQQPHPPYGFSQPVQQHGFPQTVMQPSQLQHQQNFPQGGILFPQMPNAGGGGIPPIIPQQQQPMSQPGYPPFPPQSHNLVQQGYPPSMPMVQQQHEDGIPQLPAQQTLGFPQPIQPEYSQPMMTASPTQQQYFPQPMGMSQGFPPAPGTGEARFAQAPPLPGGFAPVGPSGPGPNIAGFPSGPPQPQRQRLDPDMMPSLVQVAEDDRASRSGLFPTGFPQAENPPLVTTEIIAQDQGNSNPKFIRSTLYAVPQSSDMTKSTQLPLSLAICPFAKLHSNEYPPPVIDLADIGPVRCVRCKAYMCPFMEFIDGGRKFRCAFCKANTPVEDAYFAHLDHTGRRTDIQHRPELFLGSYEFVATKQYCKNGLAPRQPAFIFMLDVSYNAVRNGLLELFCRNIIDILHQLPRENFHDKSTMRIGLVTYDQSIHFYNLSCPERAEMMVVHDIQDVFVPFVDGFLVSFEQAESSLISCLREILRNFSQTRITETALGPVIQAGMDALRNADCAGKLFIFHTSLPGMDGAPGQLKNREDRKVLGSDKEKTILSPGTDFYSKLGEECVKVGCAVDIFLFPNSFVDVASIVPAVTTTGGSIYKYQYFDAERDGSRFLEDLRHNIRREVVFDVMMRVRTSTGIRPTGFFGSFFMQNTTDIEAATLDSDKSVQVEIKYDDKLNEREAAYFQVALLFTSCGGQRRLRIHNISLPVSADYQQIYRLIDEDCLTAHLFKQAEQLVRDKSPKEMRDELTVKCAQILAAYREKCSESAPMGQLILPECAKLLPLHINCINRHDALNGGSEITVDDRAWMMALVPSMNVLTIAQFLYPRVYPLTALGSQTVDDDQHHSGENGGAVKAATTGNADGEETVEVPVPIRASFDYFVPQEAYLVENGLVAFVFVGSQVPREWLHNVFGVHSLQQLDTEKHDLPARDNDNSRALRRLWDWTNSDRERRLKLFLVKESDALEGWMKKFLVEDRYAQNAHSYVDFLCTVHREIRSIFS